MGQKTPKKKKPLPPDCKYSAVRVKKICTLLKEGRHISHACALSGISTDTLYNWIKWDNEGDERFAGFGDLIREAKAIGEITLEQKIEALCYMGKNPDARTMMQMLTTKNREVYANLDKVELSGTVTHKLTLEQLVDGISKAKDEDASGGYS